LNSIFANYYPHNQDAQQPTNANTFLPDELINMWYGCMTLLHWGNDRVTSQIWEAVASEYYDHANSNGEEDGEDDLAGRDDSSGGCPT